jgi:hypothetical protein
MVRSQPRGKVLNCGGEVRNRHVSESVECTARGLSHDNPQAFA